MYILLIVIAVYSAYYFVHNTKFVNFHLLFIILFRGEFTVAVGIWTSLCLFWWFNVPLNDSKILALLTVPLSLFHIIACLLFSLWKDSKNGTYINNKLKF